MKTCLELAKELGIDQRYIQPYGWDKAKINLEYYKEIEDRPTGKLVLVSAIEPTKYGEGKTTTAIGLHDGMCALGMNSILCLREGSLGPVFGVKGNCVGNGKSIILPEKDLSLHFTGDMHALTSAINLISAVIENHIFQGNELNINPDRILWKRALDINDRSLRKITVTSADSKHSITHESEFVITVASELMSTACIASDMTDFKRRVNNILIAYNYNNEPVYLRDLKMSDSICLLMEQALNPNLVQTGEGNPCLVHLGPFCNISFGSNSLNATRMGLKLAPICITEVGFGGCLGLDKFCNITCRYGGFSPDVIVLVVSVKGLKTHGGMAFKDLNKEDLNYLANGMCNLEKHIEDCEMYGVPFVVAINRFPDDTDNEINWLTNWCKERGYQFGINTAVVDGNAGSKELAKTVKNVLDTTEAHFKPLYDIEEDPYIKIEKVCKKMYGAKGVEYTKEAKQQLDEFIKFGHAKGVVCIAKTPNSLSADPKLVGRPTDFIIPIREVRLAASCDMIIPLAGDIMMMPGLNKNCKALDEFAQLKL